MRNFSVFHTFFKKKTLKWNRKKLYVGLSPAKPNLMHDDDDDDDELE
jgi:hypothetical protein